MQVKYCVLLLVLYIAIPAYAQKIEFFSEDISFGIDSVFFLVNGDYSFRNNSGESRSMVIVYPIRNNNTTKPFDTILVFNNDNLTNPLKVDIKDTLATFMLHMLPHSVKTVKILYRQRHNGAEARYILLTTKLWDKPLETATYNLVVKKNIKVNQFSINPDSSVAFGETLVYYWKRENFMPTKDFEISFNLVQK